MKSKCAILLVRVSTIIQDYEPQLNDLKAYASKMGYTELKEIPTKESGLADSKNRSGLQNLYDFITKNPEYRTVFATEISRLGRRLSVLSEIKDWFVANRVQLYIKDINGFSLLEESGVVSRNGEMMYNLYGMFSESEIRFKKDRFARAKKMYMEMGISISGKTLFGYERIDIENDRTTLKPHKDNSEIVKTIFSWYLNGINDKLPNSSIKTITLECIKRNFPTYTHSKRNINKLLKEQGYTGYKVTNNKRKNPDYSNDGSSEKYIVSQNKIKYPPLIDDETFNAVQRKLKENNLNADKSSKHTTILARLIKCHACGSHLNGDYRVKDGILKHSYRCSSRAKAKPCANKQTFSMAMLDSAIWCLIKTDLKLLAKSINEINPDLDYVLLEQQKEKIQARITKINEDVQIATMALKKNMSLKYVNLADVVSSMYTKLEKLDKEKGEMEKELSRLNANLSIKKEKLNDVHEVISENMASIELSRDLLKQYVNYFVDSIDVLFHNTSYTVLKVNFIRYSILQRKRIDDGRVKIDDGEYQRQTLVALDKTNTLNIKAFKSLRSFTINDSGSLNFSTFKIDIKSAFEYLYNLSENAVLKKELRDLKLFDFKKLPVYS
jgi:DNA invertase Pin-like site-specific DNA recombinase